jgi:hypothetical protein
MDQHAIAIRFVFLSLKEDLLAVKITSLFAA